MRNAAQLRSDAISTGYYVRYVGDGASVPWEVMLTFHVPSGFILREYKKYLDSRWPGAFKLHDWLYTPYGLLIGATREEADSALREEIAVDSPADAYVVGSAVRLGGLPFWGTSPTGYPAVRDPGTTPGSPVLLSPHGVSSMSGSAEVAVFNVIQELDGQPIINVLTYVQDPGDVSPFDTAALQVACDEVNSLWIASVMPLLSIGLSYIRTDGYSLGPAIGLPLDGPPYDRYVNPPHLIATSTPAAPTLGTITGDYLPRLTAGKASKESGVAGRSNRGSIHFAGIPESSTTGDRIAPTPLANLQSMATGLLTSDLAFFVGLVAYRFHTVVYSPTKIDRLGVVGANAYGGTIQTIVSTFNSKVGTMKRRKVKGGAR